MESKVKIGQLNRRVVITQLQTTTETTGEKIKTEVAYAAVWAQLDDVSGNESVDGKVIALNVRKYTIRYEETILKEGDKMFVVDNDGTYNINGISQIGNKSYLTLKCSKRE